MYICIHQLFNYFFNLCSFLFVFYYLVYYFYIMVSSNKDYELFYGSADDLCVFSLQCSVRHMSPIIWLRLVADV